MDTRNFIRARNNVDEQLILYRNKSWDYKSFPKDSFAENFIPDYMKKENASIIALK